MIADDVLADDVVTAAKEVYEDRDKYISAMKKSRQIEAIDIILKLIQDTMP